MFTLAFDFGILLSLNLIFYVVLGLAILGGFLKGFKKSLFILVTMAIFYIVFFVTLNLFVGILWQADLSFLGPILGDNLDPSLANFTSFETGYQQLLQVLIGEEVDLSQMSGEFLELAAGIMLFVLKIVWTILYFTVILIIYKFICFIIRVVFFKTKKGANKMRGFGALVGAGNGLMAIFIMLIVMGGMMSVINSMSVLLTEFAAATEDTEGTENLSFDYRQDVYQANFSLLSETTPVDPGAFFPEDFGIEDAIEMLDQMVAEYNSNIFVKIANSIQVDSVIDEDIQVPMHINLFDSVLSFEHNENTIAFRYELMVVTEALEVFATSDYQETQDLTDIKGDEIRQIFEIISNSKLVITALPLAIEYASIRYEQELPVTVEELYDGTIDFEQELSNMGAIAGALFDILNGAGYIGGEGSLEQIEVTGETVRELFTDIAGSEIILLVTESILFPMIQNAEGDISLIVTIPADLDLEAEFIALGEIFAEIIESDVNFEDLMGDDINLTLQAISQIDLTILLESRLVTEALINVLSGAVQIEGLEMLTIPSNISWKDIGENPGELRKILEAFNALLSLSESVDVNNITIDLLVEMDQETIETFFESYVIRATVTDVLLGMDMGDMPLVFPDVIYDDLHYFTKDELVNTIMAVKLIIVTENEETTFDPNKILQLTEAEVDTLFSSNMLYATVGNYFNTMDTSLFVIPDSVNTTILVDEIPVAVVTKLELKNLFKAIGVLDLETFEGIEFDATYINRLENVAQDDIDQAQVDTLLSSEIIHATLSDTIIGLDKSQGGALVVPTEDVSNNTIVNTVGGKQYISKQEIFSALRAMYYLEITDFNLVDFDDTTLLKDNIDVLLDSAIIHATVSNEILNIGSSVVVPEKDVNNQDILINIGTTIYITEIELTALVDGLDLLGVTDPNSFDQFNFAVLDTDAKRTDLLSSAILHATISDQIFALDTTSLTVPTKDVLGNDLIVPTGTVVTNYIIKTEIKAIITAMIAMGYNDVDDFNTVNLEDTTLLKNNLDVMLDSAVIHATVSDEILNIGSSVIVPEKDIDDVDILIIWDTTIYIIETELQALVDGLDLLGVNDPNTFDQFNFAVLDTDTKRTDLLTSAILHATISDQILNVGDNLLDVPEQDELGNDLKIERGIVSVTYVIKDEVKAIIDAMIAMGYSDVASLTMEIDPQKFVDNMSLVLESSSMQATVSNQLLGTTSAIIIPDSDALSNTIRIVYPDVTFIESTELENFFIAVDLFNVPNLDFDTFNVGVSEVQAVDKNILFNSYIMVATVSDYFLDAAVGDETTLPGTTSLLIPTTERVAITVDGLAAQAMNKQEMIYMFDAFNILGLTDYNSNFDASVITGKTGAEIDQMLLSASVHVTVDNMMRGNASVASKIPALAEDNTTYAVTVTIKPTIRNFILATQQVGTGDFTNITFNAAGVAGLSPAQRDIVLDSMIVRNILTDELETMMLEDDPFDLYWPANSDYMNSDPLTFLTEDGINAVFTHYGLV